MSAYSLKVSSKDHIYLGCVYCSLNSSATNNIKLLKLFDNIPYGILSYSSVLIVRDFNIPDID